MKGEVCRASVQDVPLDLGRLGKGAYATNSHACSSPLPAPPRILTPDTFDEPNYDAAIKMYEVRDPDLTVVTDYG